MSPIRSDKESPSGLQRPRKTRLADQVRVEQASSDAAVAVRPSGSSSKGRNCLLDLRIHTPASQGYLSLGGIDTAPALVRLAKVKGLDMIGLTDFYSAAFVDRVAEAAKSTGLTVLPGTVIRARVGSCNDCILTCLFPETTNGAQVQSFLTALGVPASAAGDRNYLVDRSFKEILQLLEARGGIALPSVAKVKV